MTIHVAVRHRTEYTYDRMIQLGPQSIRLRPAPHCRTPITAYSCTISPSDHFVNWQQDPHGNYLARVVFPEPVRGFSVDVEVLAAMEVINPFDFFLQESAEVFPFVYESDLERELRPFLEQNESGPGLAQFVSETDIRAQRTIEFLVNLNQRLQQQVAYTVRLEPGVQTCEETLSLKRGSCRDSAWLLVQVLRHLGLAARFVSGYLVQLTPDEVPEEGPPGPEEDFTDLHAWTEVYLPGAGWIGLDPTSGLFAGEGHIPLACTPSPTSAAPITGTHEPTKVDFEFSMEIRRVAETPRVTAPYRDDVWNRILQVGEEVDGRLASSDVRLTMGGEPTFVSRDGAESAQWQTEALGEEKLRMAANLMHRLRSRFGEGGVVQFAQGKWYPGEPLPRWALKCYWRSDGVPLWRDATWLADPLSDHGQGIESAQRFASALAERLGVGPQWVTAAYEDVLYYLWKERRLPANVDPQDVDLGDDLERARLARLLEQGLEKPVGCLLPLRYSGEAGWESGPWVVRSEELFLVPGDSPMGFRLPLTSLLRSPAEEREDYLPIDPHAPRDPLPEQIIRTRQQAMAVGAGGPSAQDAYGSGASTWTSGESPRSQESTEGVVRAALCVEPRNGSLHVFLPPLDRLEAFVELLAMIEDTSCEQQLPVVIEGYEPPHDSRLTHLSVTPDPGVIEVNVHPAANWATLVDMTAGVYEDARATGLAAEKFESDGTHTGTGGGNHIVLGGATPSDSPFLRRPDLLKSLVSYWHNHPALSYLFSGRFLGPTSQAPRVDEGRADATYELEIGMDQILPQEDYPAWFVDRVFRHLLVDLTGNTHRAEFCIDKLFSPDGIAGRLGLVELRAFEMPPHPQMNLTQQLLIRSLVARFWEQPYEQELVPWHTSLHDRFALPHFLWQDLGEVVGELVAADFPLSTSWYQPHFEFRFPVLGSFGAGGVDVELRQAIEPWYVLGEEQGAHATARYVDSSVERLQVRVRGLVPSRHQVLCNGLRVPLHPTGREGEFVAGVRYRAWQPPSCLHPTIPVDSPLTFDVLDTWNEKSIAGGRYYVGHPGGINSDTIPVNAQAAESRRSARFISMGHHPGRQVSPRNQPHPRFPLTLDLRREWALEDRAPRGSV